MSSCVRHVLISQWPDHVTRRRNLGGFYSVCPQALYLYFLDLKLYKHGSGWSGLSFVSVVIIPNERRAVSVTQKDYMKVCYLSCWDCFSSLYIYLLSPSWADTGQVSDLFTFLYNWFFRKSLFCDKGCLSILGFPSKFQKYVHISIKDFYSKCHRHGNFIDLP